MEDLEQSSSRSGPSGGAKSPVRQIESPKFGLGLQVLDKFMNIHSPTQLSPTGQKMVFNIDTKSQQKML
jgi:hypothetical protein